jgi:hypothetical protein
MNIYVEIKGDCLHDNLDLKPIRCDKLRRKELGPQLMADGIESTYTRTILDNLQMTEGKIINLNFKFNFRSHFHLF